MKETRTLNEGQQGKILSAREGGYDDLIGTQARRIGDDLFTAYGSGRVIHGYFVADDQSGVNDWFLFEVEEDPCQQ